MTVELLNRPREIDVSSIEYGLEVILSHLEKPSIGRQFPWRIMTYLTKKQVQVSSREEAIAVFKQSGLVDCRISAFPYPVPELNGINAQAPIFFLSDLDRKKSFKTDKLFKQALAKTLQNYDNKLHGAKPTVLWSGGGYQILQPLDADIVLEEQKILKEFIRFEPSRRLMRYAEMLMTDGMADPVHNNTVAFNNCLIRIPNSYNSKYMLKYANGEPIVSPSSIPPQAKVRIEQIGSDYRPNVRYLLEGLWEHLIQLRNNEISERFRAEQSRALFEARHPYDMSPPDSNLHSISNPQTYNNRIVWIEKLLEKPLCDFRKYCVTFIFAPYFANIRQISDLDALDRIKVWLEKCKSVCRLDFNITSRVKYDIKSVRKLQRVRRFVKPSLSKLRIENPELYALLQKEKIVC